MIILSNQDDEHHGSEGVEPSREMMRVQDQGVMRADDILLMLCDKYDELRKERGEPIRCTRFVYHYQGGGL